VTTQDPQRQIALVVPDKAERVKNFHQNTLKSLQELLQAAGLHTPQELQLSHFLRRVNGNETQSLAELYPAVSKGALLKEPSGKVPEPFKTHWPKASAEHFNLS
jgi:hypothetical protein